MKKRYIKPVTGTTEICVQNSLMQNSITEMNINGERTEDPGKIESRHREWDEEEEEE